MNSSLLCSNSTGSHCLQGLFLFVCLLFYNFKTRKGVNKVTFPKVVFFKMSYRTSQRKDR